MWSNTHTGAQGPVQCSSILYTAISTNIAVRYTPYTGCDLFKAHTLPPSVLKGQRFSEESLQPLQRFAKAQSRSRSRDIYFNNVLYLSSCHYISDTVTVTVTGTDYLFGYPSYDG